MSHNFGQVTQTYIHYFSFSTQPLSPHFSIAPGLRRTVTRESDITAVVWFQLVFNFWFSFPIHEVCEPGTFDSWDTTFFPPSTVLSLMRKEKQESDIIVPPSFQFVFNFWNSFPCHEICEPVTLESYATPSLSPLYRTLLNEKREARSGYYTSSMISLCI